MSKLYYNISDYGPGGKSTTWNKLSLSKFTAECDVEP